MTLTNSWARRTTVLLYISVGLSALGVLSSWLQYRLLSGALAGRAITAIMAAANDRRHQLIERLQVGVFLICAVVFLVWLHEVYSALGTKRKLRTENTAGWAVGYWFIPIINLVRPYTIVRELWEKSHDGVPAPSHPANIGLWWGCYLVSGLSGRLASTMMATAKQIPALITVTWIGAGSDLLMAIAGMLLITIIAQVDTAQGKWGELTAGMEQVVPVTG